MAVSLNAQTRAALEAGHVDFRLIASFELESGIYRFGNHTPGEYLTWAGQLWYGLGAMVKVGALQTQSGLAADQATVTLDASLMLEVPEGYDSEATWLRDVVREDMTNRRFELHEIYLDLDTGEPVGSKRMFAGPIDGAPANLERLDLPIRVRSNRQALGWSNGRSRSDADQRRVSASDGSLRHINRVAASNGTLPWGYVPSQSGERVDPREAVRGGLGRIL
jgi:hypothetical protein